MVAGRRLVGGVAGALSATAFVPNYIRDNLALFRIGAAWIGAVEGATLALAYRKDSDLGLGGRAAGLAAGAVTGILLDDQAPNYGRVAIIQSAAAIGALAGALMVPALDLLPQAAERRRRCRARDPAVLGGVRWAEPGPGRRPGPGVPARPGGDYGTP